MQVAPFLAFDLCFMLVVEPFSFAEDLQAGAIRCPAVAVCSDERGPPDELARPFSSGNLRAGSISAHGVTGLKNLEQQLLIP